MKISLSLRYDLYSIGLVLMGYWLVLTDRGAKAVTPIFCAILFACVSSYFERKEEKA